MTRRIGREAVRFLAAGVGNTLLTLLIYQLLVLVLAPQIAYSLTWLAGIALVATFYPSRVFGVESPRAATRIAVALVYLASFLIGLVALQPAAALLGKQLGVVPVLVLTTAFNFVAMRAVIGRTERYGRPLG